MVLLAIFFACMEILYSNAKRPLTGNSGSPAGREELQELASRYYAASGKLKPAGASAITYILVHERERGLIRD